MWTGARAMLEVTDARHRFDLGTVKSGTVKSLDLPQRKPRNVDRRSREPDARLDSVPLHGWGPQTVS